jgi:predicted regulator of Ras-like GTPase activity (Roadblock/LC7/MglB family)
MTAEVFVAKNPTRPLKALTGKPATTTQIKKILHALMESSPYIKAAGLVRVSGLTVEAVMPPDIEEERVSAMSAVMLLLGERITMAMRGGRLDKVYIKGEDSHIILTSVGKTAVLTVMADDKAPLGLLFVEMRAASEKLKKLI